MSKITQAKDIQYLILTIKGNKVIMDADLAALYAVTTSAFNQAVKRNEERFPDDFRFQLDDKDLEFLRSQSVISNKGRGGRRYNPYVFTEHGAIMAANILNSPEAIKTSVEVVRAFVRLRQMALDVTDLNRKVKAMEMKYDEQFRAVFQAIRELIQPAQQKPKRPIGFESKMKK